MKESERIYRDDPVHIAEQTLYSVQQFVANGDVSFFKTLSSNLNNFLPSR